MTREQVLQAIAAHERAAERAKTPAKRMQHIRAIEHYRKTYGLPEPVTFGRDEMMYRRQAIQRAEAERIDRYKRTGKVIP